jgi:hypothetical protein
MKHSFERRMSGNLPDRAHRLLLCALCRLATPQLDPVLMGALEVIERFADGEASADELRRASEGARALAGGPFDRAPALLANAVVIAGMQAEPDEWNGRYTMDPFAAGRISTFVWVATGLIPREGLQPRPDDNLRDGQRFPGDPYPALFDDIAPRPVSFSPEWRTDTAVALARQMYDSRDFGAMPILADALQDAGCDNEGILTHCRGEGPHVRGCWVVDLVLGKE